MKFIISFILLLFIVNATSPSRFNVCKTLQSYSNKNSENCYYNPDFNSNTTGIILGNNYPLEEHFVTTKDGYILLLHRIPHNKTSTLIGQPVFIQHGALSSSEVFVVQGEKSLGFLFSNMGYDVWLGNSRGNFNSPNHINMTIRDDKFWDFSLDDLANYDLPAVIDKIVEVTQKPGEIIYIGHSQGTTIGLMYSSIHNDHAKRNLKVLILLAPVAYVTNLKIPATDLAMSIVEFLYYQIGIKYLGSDLKLFSETCIYNEITIRFCIQIPELLYGKFEDFDVELLPMFFKLMLQRESLKSLVHYTQIAHSRKFSAFDYKEEKNLRVYKTPEPPIYKFNKIKVPIRLFYADNDNFVPLENINRLYDELKTLSNASVKRVLLRGINGSRYNHANFVSAKDFKNAVFKKIIESLQTI